MFKYAEDVMERVRNTVDFNQDLDDERVRTVIDEVVAALAKDHNLNNKERKELSNFVFNQLRRWGILQPLLDEEAITEIMVNGPDTIFIERDGVLQLTNHRFSSKQALEDLIQRIVAKVNRVVNESNPIVDARLEDGSRIHVVLPPLALNGPILTIRKFSKKAITMDKLISYGSINEEVHQLLKMLVACKYNIFICGGTGSGKTTFLNALSACIPSEERVITIEDSAELQIQQLTNLVSMETRNANVEGKGQISIRQLIKASLRMRPDRIVVGEVRGEEALDMLQAMNTGHDGSLSTGHANSCRDMLSRLETMVLTGAEIPLEAIRQQISSAIDIMVHLGRLRDKSRRVLEINEILGYSNNTVQLNPLYKFMETSTSREKVIGELVKVNPLVYKEKIQSSGYAYKEVIT